VSNTPFFDMVAKIDKLVQKNQLDDSDIQLIKEISIDEDYTRVFFQKLESPDFNQKLEELGLFANPPEPMELPSGGFKVKVWPQSQYLAHIAQEKPEWVANIFSKLNTENWLILRDMIRAVKSMPAENAATLINKIADSVQHFKLFYMLGDIGEIIKNLVDEGMDDEAFTLTEKAFDLTGFADSNHILDTAEYMFFESLKKFIIPVLEPRNPYQLLELLCDWLSQAIEIEQKDKSEPGPPEDYSNIWRPAIENHSQNRDYDFHAKLITPIREAFQSAIAENRISLTEAIAILDNHAWNIFERFKIHLITEFGSQNPQLVRETIFKRAIFDPDYDEDHDYAHLKHEYARLVTKYFDTLSDDERELWLAWVEEGPAWAKGEHQREFDSEEDRQKRIEYWKFSKLHLVNGRLAGDLKQFYDRMFIERGTPILADFHSYSSGVYSPSLESPFSIEQLRQMGLEQAVLELLNWQKKDDEWDQNGPTRAGFIRIFGEFVQEDAPELSSQAAVLKEKHPRIIRAFLEGLENAVKEGVQIELESVLDLCEWVTQQPVDKLVEPITNYGDLGEKDWHWIFDTVGSLLKEIFKAKLESGSLRYQKDFRSRFASIIKKLLSVPARRYIYMDRGDEDPRTFDWVMVTINSPRGKAMETLFDFARWVAVNLEGDPNKHKIFPGGFTKLLEVKDILEEQLTRKDADFTERAMFGYHLNFLYWLDRDWLEQHADQILNIKDDEKALGWAAWSSFLYALNPHREYYRILKSQFHYAVETAAKINLPSDSREVPFERLSQHLLILYGWGQLGEEQENALNTKGGIIHRLVCESQEPIRVKAIASVGELFHQRINIPGQEILNRYKNLWDHYWNTIGKTDASHDPKTGVFGYWFYSGVFDNKWSIEQLEKVAKVAPKMHPNSLIVEQLAKICETDPALSSTIIKLFTEGDDEGWLVDSWKDDAYKILEIAMNTDDEAREIAEQTIDILGRRGHLNFGKLLNPPN